MNSENFTNGTQIYISINRPYQITKIVFFILSFLTYGFFLYFISNILAVYFTSTHVRENSRYILFAHMLVTDTVYLSLGLFLGVIYQFSYMPVPVCYFLITVATASFRVTPYNLAVMALERYLAICFPLRYFLICTARNSYLTIVVMWMIGVIPNLVDLILLVISVPNMFVSQNVMCKQERLVFLPLQNTLRSFTYIGSLALVALIILFTYIEVTMIAQKSGSNTSSASKAGKTVMLHAFQLLLCMMSLCSSVTEFYGGDFMVMANFFFFMCVPRLLSPLVYGLRDEAFSKRIRMIYFIKIKL